MWRHIARYLAGCWACWPSRVAEGPAGGDRCDDAGGQRGDAGDRAARHRRELRGVLARTGEGFRHRNADARGLGATGPQAQEAHVEPGVEESGGRGCADCEDERRAHALGAQGRARGRSGHGRGGGGDAARRRPGRHDDAVLTAACAASVSTRRTNLLPLAERLLWFSSALSFCPGQVPTHEVNCAAEGNVLACAPTSAITCCAESAPKPGTSASRTTAS